MIEVSQRTKDALRDGCYLKNYRILVAYEPYSDTQDAIITNDNLVSESVTISDKMCSDDMPRFGTCEGASIEFEYFDTDDNTIGNIKGKRIKVFIDVQYKDADSTLKYESIDMGYYDVTTVSRQTTTGIMKATAYNRLAGDKLDESVLDRIKAIVAVGDGSDGTESTRLDSIIADVCSDVNILISDDNESFGITAGHAPRYVSRFSDMYQVTSPDKSKSYQIYIYTDSDFTIYNYNFTTSHSCDGSTYFNYAYADAYLNAIEDAYAEVYGIDGWNVLFNGKYYDFRYWYEHFEELYAEAHNLDYYPYNHWGLTLETGGGEFPLYEYQRGQYIKTDARACSSVGFMGYMHTYLSLGANDAYGLMTTLQETIASKIEAVCDSLKPIQKVTPISDNIFDKLNYVTPAMAEEFEDVTVRELIQARYELLGKYVRLDRNSDRLITVDTESRLYPNVTVYPSDTLYPYGSNERGNASIYEKLWVEDTGYSGAFNQNSGYCGYKEIYVYYKTKTDYSTYDLVLYGSKYKYHKNTYSITDNWILNNIPNTRDNVQAWLDAGFEYDVGTLEWIPFEMWLAGLPYMEVGDSISVKGAYGDYHTYIMSRTLAGIQDLHDTYSNGTVNFY